jgi:hypothetical protein
MDRFMVDVIEVYDISDSEESVFDPVTLTSSPKQGDLVYDGPARVRPTRGPKEMAVGESVIVMRDADFSLPWNAPAVQRDQMIRVKSTEDPELQGRWFRITDATLAGQSATRKCSGVQVQPSRLWKVDGA